MSGEELNDWGLHGQTEEGGVVWRTSIRPTPFLIGRLPTAHLRLRSPGVSVRHAELFTRDDGLWVRDLGSTNGTFVNGRGVQGEQSLAAGDIVHFADQEFRLTAPQRRVATEIIASPTMQISHTQAAVEPKLIREVREFLGSIEEQDVRIEFQAVVDMTTGLNVGYEALGRAKRPSLPVNPGELFQIAERIGLSRELCTAFRRKTLAISPELPDLPDGRRPQLFLNSHPMEIRDSEVLLDDLAEFRTRHGGERIVLEIHETAITDPQSLATLRERLEVLHIAHAFDDFGSGEARLKELCESAPHLVKFDAHFARDLPSSPRRFEVVRSLVNLMKSLQVETLIEGVETEEEVQACRELGFEFAQGYYFARPVPLDALA